MNLTSEQLQLLQTYMMKNRTTPQAVQAPPVQLPAQSGGGGAGAASILSTLGGFFDTPADSPLSSGVQGPVRPAQQSWLSKFADRLDPAAAQQRQILSQRQTVPKMNMDQIMAALAKAGIK